MGQIKQGILGGFSGRVGTVVGSSWKSVHYMRALAVSISNPRTLKQQVQRNKFTTSMSFLKAITPYVRVGYKGYSQNVTPFNAAMSYILRHGITGDGLNLTVNYPRVLVARGSLMPAFNAAATSTGGKVSFTWTDNSETGDALSTDIAMPLVYNKAKGEAIYSMDAATRADGKAELELPSSWADDALAVYLAFRSDNGERMANSICLLNEAYEGNQDKPNGGGSGGGSGEDQNENPLG